MTERQLQDAVVAAARALGWLVYHTFDSRRSQPGYPDLTMARRGRLIFAELKTTTGELRPEQHQWVETLGAVSVATDQVDVYVWRPEDWHTGRIEQALRG